ncbi:pigment-dispersing hormone peptides isoform X2 [Diachasmimorpha longicaudata]|uniref:pigment-dispersing hormone peptides isoform X2 n=1 Tax=Diachasmimorpha longicaudata TaxID=58733 RepID=UPI0030B8FB0E
MKPSIKNMNSIFFVILLVIIVDSTLGTIDDADRELMTANFPYGRGDNELQLARILYLLPQRGIMCHPKRNSEIINSLLGLPKNMNNAGK